MTIPIRQKGYLFIGVAMIELSLLAIISKIGAAGIGTMPFLFFAFIVASITSLALVIYKKKIADLKKLFADKRSLSILALAGILNYAGAQLFLTLGVLGTNPVTTTIVLKLWPIMMALMIPFVMKTRITRMQMAALLIAFVGVYILLTNGLLVSINAQELPYIGFVVLSTLCTAASNVMIKSQNHDIYSSVFLFNIASLAVVAVLIPVLNVNLGVTISFPVVASVVFLGAITYSAGALLFFYGLKMNPLMTASASYSTPFLTILFSYIILGTQFQTYYLYALAFVLVALFIQNRGAKRAAEYIGAKQKGIVQLYDVTGAFVENTHPHIHPYIRGGGRALAAKIKISMYTGLQNNNIHDCLVFTNKEPPESVRREEVDFIEGMVGPGPDELILLALGNPESAESALLENMNPNQA